MTLGIRSDTTPKAGTVGRKDPPLQTQADGMRITEL
jgi:hypothetical protein